MEILGQAPKSESVLHMGCEGATWNVTDFVRQLLELRKMGEKRNKVKRKWEKK